MAKYYYFCHNFVFLQVLRKSSLYRLTRYAIVILCLIFLVYKVLSIDNPHIVLEHFCKASRQRFLLLVVAVALLPVNIVLESIKWQTALRNTVSLPFTKTLFSMEASMPMLSGSLLCRAMPPSRRSAKWISCSC